MKTSKGILVVLSSLVPSFTNFVIAIYVARSLGVVEFGKVNYLLEIAMLLISIADLGVTAAVVTKYNLYVSKYSPIFANSLISSVFWFKFITSLFATMLYYILIRNHIDATSVLFGLSIVPLSLYFFFIVIYQAKMKFFSMVVLKLVHPVVKGLLLVLVLSYFAPLTGLGYSLIITLSALVVAAIVLVDNRQFFAMIPRKSRTKRLLVIFKDFWAFLKWSALASLVTAVVMRIDILMLESLADSVSLGLYSGVSKIVYVLPVLSGAIQSVLLPLAAKKVGEKGELGGYFSHGYTLVALCVIPLLFLPFFSELILSLTLGNQFLPGSTTFKILFFSSLIGIALLPISTILIATQRIKALAAMNVFQLICNVVFNALLIPDFGSDGAAFGTLFTRIIGMGFILYLFIDNGRNREKISN